MIERTSDLWGPLDRDHFAFLYLIVVTHYGIELLMIEIYLLIKRLDLCPDFLLNLLSCVFCDKFIPEGKLQESFLTLFVNLHHKVAIFLYDYENIFGLEQLQTATVFAWP